MTCDTIAFSIDMYRAGFIEALSMDIVVYYLHHCQALV